mmetsp:Transcript_39746/g.88339  ORF Transcript_39746/g.88339 Transcript_39746/m.88339 type:complete len:576 (-) Transcript_39746:529-2256(-)
MGNDGCEADEPEKCSVGLADVLRILPRDQTRNYFWNSLRLNLRLTSRELLQQVSELATTLVLHTGIPWGGVPSFVKAASRCTDLQNLSITFKLGENTASTTAVLVELRNTRVAHKISSASLYFHDDSGSCPATEVLMLLEALTALLPALRTLRLDNMDVESCGPAWTGFPHLSTIVVSCPRHKPDDNLFNSLATLPSLTDLTIAHTKLHGPTAWSALGKLTMLSSLRLRLQGQEPLDAALSTLTRLTFLEWQDRRFPEYAADLPEQPQRENNAALGLLTSLVNLQQLLAPYLVVRDEGIKGIAAMTQLNYLDIGSVVLQAPAPPWGHTLRFFHTWHPLPPLAVVQQLGPPAHPQPNLLVIDSGRFSTSCACNACPVSAHGVQRVADGLRYLLGRKPVCDRVYLRGKLEAVAVDPILCALRPVKRALELYGMRLRNLDLEQVAVACPQLRELYLEHCWLECGALRALSQLHNISLLSLDSVWVLPHDELYNSSPRDAPPEDSCGWLRDDLANLGAAWSQAHRSSTGSAAENAGPGLLCHVIQRHDAGPHRERAALVKLLQRTAPGVTVKFGRARYP